VDEGLRQALVPVGMACVLSAAMRTPIAAIVMVMEMTGGFGLIVPLMVATMAAYVIGGRFGLVAEQVESAADSPAHAGDAVVNVLERLRVADVVQAIWPATASRSTPLSQLVGHLPEGEAPTVAVLERDRLVGLIPFATLLHLLDRHDLPAAVIADDILVADFEALPPDASLYDALGVFERSGSDAVPVVHDGVFLGMLTRRRVRDLVFEHVGRMRDRLLREHAGLAAIEEQTQLVHLLSGMPAPEAGRVDRVPVDEELADRSLRELDFRARRGGVVLAIQTTDHRLECPPDPGRPLRHGEHLVVLTPSAVVPPDAR
jgi:CBS domain-containing protein